MNRRRFLQVLGLVPFVPLAAKLPVLAPAVAPTDPVEEIPTSTRWVRPMAYEETVEFELPAGYVSQFDKLWVEIQDQQRKKAMT